MAQHYRALTGLINEEARAAVLPSLFDLLGEPTDRPFGRYACLPEDSDPTVRVLGRVPSQLREALARGAFSEWPASREWPSSVWAGARHNGVAERFDRRTEDETRFAVAIAIARALATPHILLSCGRAGWVENTRPFIRGKVAEYEATHGVDLSYHPLQYRGQWAEARYDGVSLCAPLVDWGIALEPLRAGRRYIYLARGVTEEWEV